MKAPTPMLDDARRELIEDCICALLREAEEDSGGLRVRLLERQNARLRAKLAETVEREDRMWKLIDTMIACDNRIEEIEHELAMPARDRRDVCIRETLLLYDGPKTRRAKMLAVDMARYASSGWLRDSEQGGRLGGADAKRQAWFDILTLSHGKPLGWRQIYTFAC